MIPRLILDSFNDDQLSAWFDALTVQDYESSGDLFAFKPELFKDRLPSIRNQIIDDAYSESYVPLCKHIPALLDLCLDQIDEDLDESRYTTEILHFLLALGPHPSLLSFANFTLIEENLLGLMIQDDQTVADLATKVVRKCLLADKGTASACSPNAHWNCICRLVNSPETEQRAAGYKLWVRWLIFDSVFLRPYYSLNVYWQPLQRDLTSSHELRKYSLHVLSHSLQSLDYAVNTTTMVFEPHKDLSQWQRYTSLVEILSLDTSLHQAQDALGSLRFLIGPESAIPHSWAVTLLATGLTTTMDTIKDLVLNFFFGLDDKVLQLFHTDVEFVTETFLIQALKASYFVVFQDPNQVGCDKYSCPYAEKVAVFVCRFVMSMSDSLVLNKFLIHLFTQIRDERYTYDPARLYVVIGVERALREKKILARTTCELISMLNSGATSKLRDRTFRLACVNLLFSAQPEVPVVPFLVPLLNQDPVLLSIVPKVKHLSEDLSQVSIPPWLKAQLLSKSLVQEFLSSLDSEARADIVNRGLSAASLMEGQDLEGDSLNIVLARDRLGLSLPEPTSQSLDFLSIAKDLVLRRPQLYHEGLAAVIFSAFTNKAAPHRDEALAQAYILVSRFRLGASDLQLVLDRSADDFDTASFRTRMDICRALTSIFGYADLAQLEPYLPVLFESMWTSLTCERLISNEKELHFALIDAVLHHRVVRTTNEQLQHTLEMFCLNLIAECHARRSLLYRVAHAISATQWLHWKARVYCKIFTFMQSHNRLFTMECVISKTCGEYQDNDPFDEFYGPDDLVAKAIAVCWLAAFAKTAAPVLYSIIASTPNLWKPAKRNEGVEELRRAQCFQLLLLADAHKGAPNLKTQLLEMLHTEPSPVVRIYVEWMLARDILKDGLHQMVLDMLINAEEVPRVLNSMLKIGIMVMRECKDAVFAKAYIHRVLACAAANRASVRHLADALVHALAHDEWVQNEPQLAECAFMVRTVAESLQSSETFLSFRPGDMMVWRLTADLTLTGICGEVVRKVSDKEVESLTVEFKQVYSGLLMLSGMEIGHHLGRFVQQQPFTERVPQSLVENHTIQTKSGAWLEREEDKKVDRGELIVVASLVDKPPNLGGICRLCDVLGVQTLCVNDLAVVQHPQFRNVSVTAEQWVPIEQVKAESVLTFMLSKQSEGYTLIGLEQTDHSVVLDHTLSFPRRSILLLGREREGIPADLLAHLDMCVEIKQVGVVRSMNIQTATAVVVHAYSSQHC